MKRRCQTEWTLFESAASRRRVRQALIAQQGYHDPLEEAAAEKVGWRINPDGRIEDLQSQQ